MKPHTFSSISFIIAAAVAVAPAALASTSFHPRPDRVWQDQDGEIRVAAPEQLLVCDGDTFTASCLAFSR